MLKIRLFLSLLLFFTCGFRAQIIPPGLGKTTLNSWFAVGFNQKLDTLDKGGWNSVSYLGIGGISNRNTINPIRNLGILILNQEFFHNFSKHWNYSLAFSYRRQNLYQNEPNFEPLDPRLKQELRFYSRFSYQYSNTIFAFSPTLRQEIISYFTPKFEPYDEMLRIRTRIRLKFTFNLTKDKQHKILVYSEQLFSTSKLLNQKKWTAFGYNDSRFSAFYSTRLKKAPITINIGYMYNLIGLYKPFSGHYLSVDLVWSNLFKHKKK